MQIQITHFWKVTINSLRCCVCCLATAELMTSYAASVINTGALRRTLLLDNMDGNSQPTVIQAAKTILHRNMSSIPIRSLATLSAVCQPGLSETSKKCWSSVWFHSHVSVKYILLHLQFAISPFYF